ncbi:MAG: 1-acyl-sn-glycerol-3-phosphate acyltransferase [Chlorobiaceae bacterium]|nr:1-acyl-sn-glycerol-3-phosphate acyltransferase [Chlorobiaceae bacterium]NTW10377.1 1-acyl-sn-glycerol-3-phosphate acyltransferase [Chlorobiaceae bacterium]
MIPNFFLTRAYGLENLSKGACARIYAFNHNNSAEALLVPVFIMYHLGGTVISFVIDWMYGKVPLLGHLMEMIDPVYVFHKRSKIPWIEHERPQTSDDVIGQCADKVLSGRSIGIFPEGRRNRNPGQLLKGKPGIAHIALMTGAPVIPVGIDFNCRTSKNKIPVIGRTIIRVGRPLHFRRECEAYREIRSRPELDRKGRIELHRIAEDVTHEIMLSLSGLSGKHYTEPCPALKYNRQPKFNNIEEQPCPV